MNEENLCILIDFENIEAGAKRENLGKFNIKLVMNHLKEKGRIIISRAYGDWGRFARFKQSLLEQGISMMELTSYRGQDKNRADIALVVDAMELVYSRPHINTFVLLSGDSDFTPLVMKLRELDKRIIGLGTRKATSRLLASSCDEFIFYDNLLKRSQKEEESTDDTSLTPNPLTSQEAFALLIDTVKVIQRDEPRPVSAGRVKQFILRKTPTFDETDFGYSGFTDFLEAAAKSKLINIVDNDKGGGYLVSIKDTVPIIKTIEAPTYQHPLANKWSSLLVDNGIHPTTHFIRHTVVHEFVDHILDRRARKKRSTLVFTYGDVARRCRKTEPPANTTEVEHILNALYKAGELYGNDQKPIRSKKANFTIKKDAEDLLHSLRYFYFTQLIESVEPELIEDNVEALCEILWNDTTHLTETKELLANHQQIKQTPVNPEEPPVSETSKTVEENKDRKVQTSTNNPVDEKPKKTPRKRTTKKKVESTETEDSATQQTTAKSADNNPDTIADSEAAKPKKNTRKRTVKKKTAPVTSTEETTTEDTDQTAKKKTTKTDVDTSAEVKPKKTTRKRTTKKKTDETTENAEETSNKTTKTDVDTSAEVKPKKTTRKRTTKKKTDETTENTDETPKKKTTRKRKTKDDDTE